MDNDFFFDSSLWALLEGGVTAMGEFLTNVGTFFTTAVGWMGDVLTTITGNPALLVLCLAMPICGFAVGLLGRLVRL